MGSVGHRHVQHPARLRNLAVVPRPRPGRRGAAARRPGPGGPRGARRQGHLVAGRGAVQGPQPAHPAGVPAVVRPPPDLHVRCGLPGGRVRLQHPGRLGGAAPDGHRVLPGHPSRRLRGRLGRAPQPPVRAGRGVAGRAVRLAVAAFFGTQIEYDGIALFAVFFGLMGVAQGINPPVNRPMVMAVTPPEQRAAAFAIYVSVFEAIAWAAFSLGAGFLGDVVGLRPVFLWVLVILMLVNGAVLTLLYRPYAQDVARVQGELDRRRRQALGAG
ncbi:MFS transporter [Streptomyces sp. NPDC059262]|uniref:MFS transporter n=1 Tax=Streptomyces sp. NPDC059262 TaxID=3346797 RepID=UPI00367830FE